MRAAGAIIILLIVAMFIFADLAFGTNYYAKQGGDDENGGTNTTDDSWLTGEHALSAGDTLFFLDSGGDLTNGWVVISSGTLADPIVFTNYPGQDPTFDMGDITDPAQVIGIDDKDNLIFDGLDFENCYRMFYMQGGPRNITIQNCTTYNTGDNPAVHINDEGIDSFTFKDNWIDRADTVGKTVDVGNCDGVTIWRYGDSVLIEGNYFTRHGHQPVNVYQDCDYVIIRDNVAERNHGAIGGNLDAQYVLIEGNTFTHPGSYGDDGTMYQWLSNQLNSDNEPLIFRGNIGYDDTVNASSKEDGLLAFSAETANRDCKNQYLYHNTIDGVNDASYDKAILRIVQQSYATGGDNENNHIVNNIFAYPSDNWVIFWEEDSREADTTWFANEYRANLLTTGIAGDTLWKIQDSLGNKTYNLTQMEAGYSTVSGNKDSLPGFTDSAAHDYTLQATSWAVGNADTLTSARFPGSGVDTVSVGDSFWFCDGWGMITGDSIWFNGSVHEISSIDYANHRLTLASVASWSAGDGIYFYRNGVQWDDVGAEQYTALGGRRRMFFIR